MTFACCSGVAHTRKEGQALGLQPVSQDEEEEGICAMSGVAGTYTVKLLCSPESHQDSCQCVWVWTN